MAFPWSLKLFNLVNALLASWRRFIHINAHPLGGIRSIETISPYSPKVSESSSWWTNLDRWPTHRVVLHTTNKILKFRDNHNQIHLQNGNTSWRNMLPAKWSFLMGGNPFLLLSRFISFFFSLSSFSFSFSFSLSLSRFLDLNKWKPQWFCTNETEYNQLKLLLLTVFYEI